MRFSKWTPHFSLEADSPILVRVAFVKLLIFLFNKEALFEIGKLIGKPIKVDGYTTNKSKLNQASVCIELDITQPHPTHVWINLLDFGLAVKVSYFHIGHEEIHCLANEKASPPLCLCLIHCLITFRCFLLF